MVERSDTTGTGRKVSLHAEGVHVIHEQAFSLRRQCAGVFRGWGVASVSAIPPRSPTPGNWLSRLWRDGEMPVRTNAPSVARFAPNEPSNAPNEPSNAPNPGTNAPNEPSNAPNGPSNAPNGPSFAPNGPSFAPNGPSFALN